MQNLDQNAIYKLISTPAYWDRKHSDHTTIQQQVTSWFQGRYNSPTSSNLWQNLGKTLFIGEGNFSFSHCIASKNPLITSHIISTVFEQEKDISKETRQNALALKKLGVAVLYEIDATDLSSDLSGKVFDTIIFQFPHTGSRDPLYGRNSNFILIRRFLKSALKHLTAQGKIIITTIDNPHYQGAFQFEDAAKDADYHPPQFYSFDMASFPGYNHTNTNDENSAIDNPDTFKSWTFKPKKPDEHAPR